MMNTNIKSFEQREAELLDGLSPLLSLCYQHAKGNARANELERVLAEFHVMKDTMNYTEADPNSIKPLPRKSIPAPGVIV